MRGAWERKPPDCHGCRLLDRDQKALRGHFTPEGPFCFVPKGQPTTPGGSLICRQARAPFRFRVFGLTLLIIAAVAVPWVAHSQETIKDLYKVFKIEEIRSDFLIVLDTSGSMTEENRFENAKKAIRGFVQALAPGDHITIIAFDTLPHLLVSREVSKDIESILKEIPAAPNPGGYTAIGSALEMTLQELARPGAHQSQFIFFLTDGTENPPKTDKFKKGVWDKNWETLKLKAG